MLNLEFRHRRKVAIVGPNLNEEKENPGKELGAPPLGG